MQKKYRGTEKQGRGGESENTLRMGSAWRFSTLIVYLSAYMLVACLAVCIGTLSGQCDLFCLWSLFSNSPPSAKIFLNTNLSFARLLLAPLLLFIPDPSATGVYYVAEVIEENSQKAKSLIRTCIHVSAALTILRTFVCFSFREDQFDRPRSNLVTNDFPNALQGTIGAHVILLIWDRQPFLCVVSGVLAQVCWKDVPILKLTLRLLLPLSCFFFFLKASLQYAANFVNVVLPFLAFLSSTAHKEFSLHFLRVTLRNIIWRYDV